MLITMKLKEFKSLDSQELGQVCFQPMIQAYKSKMTQQHGGDDATFKSQFYKQLTQGQQALFTFFVYYSHATKSTSEFYWFSNYFKKSSILLGIKDGLKFFKDNKMIQIIEELEVILESRDLRESITMEEDSYSNLEKNPELLKSISQIHTMFNKIAPTTLKLIGAYIKNNPHEFVQFEE
ncbi:hypothetical protein [Clostridium saccharoperbutylacetonicum]|uniref:hypothetical protein n=1 Tax=Clostridium saccharoperbutylacetonicum TaxID=36745 RepID=UPI0039E78EFE